MAVEQKTSLPKLIHFAYETPFALPSPVPLGAADVEGKRKSAMTYQGYIRETPFATYTDDIGRAGIATRDGGLVFRIPDECVRVRDSYSINTRATGPA